MQFVALEAAAAAAPRGASNQSAAAAAACLLTFSPVRWPIRRIVESSDEAPSTQSQINWPPRPLRAFGHSGVSLIRAHSISHRPAPSERRHCQHQWHFCEPLAFAFSFAAARVNDGLKFCCQRPVHISFIIPFLGRRSAARWPAGPPTAQVSSRWKPN